MLRLKLTITSTLCLCPSPGSGFNFLFLAYWNLFLSPTVSALISFFCYVAATSCASITIIKFLYHFCLCLLLALDYGRDCVFIFKFLHSTQHGTFYTVCTISPLVEWMAKFKTQVVFFITWRGHITDHFIPSKGIMLLWLLLIINVLLPGVRKLITGFQNYSIRWYGLPVLFYLWGPFWPRP